jgi:L-ascorbate metabolism protein UlaG (beta-lactamase superfamily)
MAEVIWHGHGTWSLRLNGDGKARAGHYVVVIDPFFDDNPSSDVKASAVAADFILVSHGHFDHVADAASIAKRTGATVVSNFEICQWLGKQGVSSTRPMNTGGRASLPFGEVKLTIAFHSSNLPDGSSGGHPCGFLITADGKRMYFACDTALFGDMALIGKGGLDLAVVPIGDTFTMGIDDSIEAVRLLNPRRAAPSHYNTWPPIAQEASLWAQRVAAETSALPVVIKPGEAISV